jgi:hypothetical protein
MSVTSRLSLKQVARTLLRKKALQMLPMEQGLKSAIFWPVDGFMM